MERCDEAITERNWIGTAAGVIGIASALYFLLMIGLAPGWPVLIPLLAPTLAITLGVIGIVKGRREGSPIGMAVTGLSLGMLTILLFIGLIILALMMMGY